ncbi:MAG TPA: SDR family oxidoreductase [Acetobacteraceae bacterium]|nr:SDR family oxidoreductase [Acetobacteraceae bacterium]
MRKTVVVTGAGAGVGRAVVRAFAERGCDVGLLARDGDRLAAAAAEVEARGGRACAVPTDVADPTAVEAAAERVERALGPIDIWVNDAMVTIFAPVHEITANEFRRETEVTYLGTVYGTMAALRRMRTRGRGSIVQVGSALSYRAIPLQSAYCGAKFAIRGFTDALRCELLHERLAISLCMVQLPAVNTPQFDWALAKLAEKPQPVPPIYQPEVAAAAIVFAAFNPRREVWLGLPTWKAILANRLAPGLLDRFLARTGYSGQMRNEPQPADAPGNLFETVLGPQAAHGSFDDQARSAAWTLWATEHRTTLAAASSALLGAACLGLWKGRRAVSHIRHSRRPRWVG